MESEVPMQDASTASSPVSSCSAVPENIQCRVCNRPYDGSQHFGIEVCRACAAFFRRSVNGQKSFVCRRGANKCQLNTPRKITCQKCRWVRCLKVGLQVELVNSRRFFMDVDGKKKGDSSGDDHSETASSGEDCKEEIASLPPTKNMESPKLLYSILDNYIEFSTKRRTMESQINCENSQTVIIHGINFQRSSKMLLQDIFRKQKPLLMTFLENTFSVFERLGPSCQKQLVDDFYPLLLEIESSYWTYRYLNKHECHNKLITSQTTILDLDSVSIFALSEDLRYALTSAHRNYLAPMHEISISEIEFLAVVMLKLWNPKRFTSELASVARSVRTQIYDDLHAIYRTELAVDNYAERVADLTLLVNGMNESCWTRIVDQ